VRFNKFSEGSLKLPQDSPLVHRELFTGAA
jgi:hypothetical protein